MTKPLDGVRILAAEQMQALPYATQLLARLGADVVKVEPVGGESGRGSQPSMIDPEGRSVGATFLRNNLDKRSLALDLRSPAGKDLFLRLVPKFDVVAENFKAGAMDRLGLGYDAVAAVHPAVIYVSVSGFGNRGGSPYADWPAYSAIVEAMSGIYEFTRRPGDAPGPTRWAPWATSAPGCSPSSASWPPCATATARARASTSTSPCTTPPWP